MRVVVGLNRRPLPAIGKVPHIAAKDCHTRDLRAVHGRTCFRSFDAPNSLSRIEACAPDACVWNQQRRRRVGVRSDTAHQRPAGFAHPVDAGSQARASVRTTGDVENAGWPTP